MKYILRSFIFILILFILFWGTAPSVWADGIDKLQGLYEGQITMWETGRKVNLRIALNLLEETDPQTEEQLQMVGVFTIDDEGGPYRFSKISLDMETGRLDMRYTRPNRTRILNSPSHFRLIGRLLQNDPLEFTGKVLSGFSGPVGEFSVKRVSDQTTLASIPKYFGRWSGMAHFKVGMDPFRILLNSSGQQTFNPDDFEFDFTNGKIGSMIVRGQPIGFSSVFIDYLRGQLILVNGIAGQQTTLTLVTKYNEETHGLSGFVNSSRIGQNGTFEAAKE